MSYIGEARARARRRRGRWNLLLIPAALGPWWLMSWFSAVGLGEVHRLLYPGREFVILPEGISGVLMAVAPTIAWLAPAMIAGNLLVAAVRPAKQALDGEAGSVPGTGLSSSNRALLRVARVVTPAALLLGLFGALVKL